MSDQQPNPTPSLGDQDPAAVPPPPGVPSSPLTGLFRLRSVIAVGLAGIIVGGIGGTTVTAVATGDDNPPGRSQHDRGANPAG